MSRDATTAADVWRQACARLADIGADILTDPIVATERDGAEGIRHLLRQLNFAIQSEIEFADPEHPALFRFDDDVVKWGGPNADNHYLRTAIDPTRTYRFETTVTGVRQLILSLHEGDMQLGRVGVYGERSLADLDADPDGRLTVLIGPDPQPGNWIPTDPAARLLLVRLYVADWERDAVPPMLIELADRATAAPTPVTLSSMGDGLERALAWIEQSVPFWFSYLRGMEAGDRNVLSPPATPPGGAADIAYGGGLWSLSEHDAWLIEFDVPDAGYWSIQTHTWPFFESGDFADRQTSLNHRQAHVDPDGIVRIAVSSQDPGIANWIDTEERPTGLVVYRWVWARSRPVPAGRVVPVEEVARIVPPSHPLVGPDERRSELGRRRRSAQRRFRR